MNSIEALLDDIASGRRRSIRILGASGQLGYGIPAAAFEAGLARRPDMIGCDMGSIDIGPAYLGSGRMATSRSSTKQDLRRVLGGARQLGIPLVIGSAGSAGAAPHLDGTLELVREIAAEDGLSFTLAYIPADMSRSVVKAALREGRIRPMDTMPDMTEADVDAAAHIVGQMGVEAFQRALRTGADVIIAGRACDTGIFSALPIMAGLPAGLAIHMAKIVECASLCCRPGGRDAILATIDSEGFELESMNPERAATPASVAGHSLYEQADPFTIREPAGAVDLSNARFEALDARRTRVSGAEFHPASRQTIKLEGAVAIGSRAVLLCAAADPSFIQRIAGVVDRIKDVVRDLVCENAPEDYQLAFRLYGIDGVRPLDVDGVPHSPHEIFILGECLAPNPERAMQVMRTTKQYLLHLGFEGRMSTAGNLAFPFTPPEVDLGPAYRFNIYHIMEVDDISSLFPLRTEKIGSRNQVNAVA